MNVLFLVFFFILTFYKYPCCGDMVYIWSFIQMLMLTGIMGYADHVSHLVTNIAWCKAEDIFIALRGIT